MKKYVICENDAVDREDFRAELDTFGPGMDFCDTILIIGSGKLNSENTLNLPIFKDAEHASERISEEFERLEEEDAPESDFKVWLDVYSVPYTPERLEQLRNWARVVAEYGLDFDTLADFLTIKTGKQWIYDWEKEGEERVDFLYCKDHHKNGTKKEMDFWLGRAKEYAVFSVDEEGDIEDAISGNIYRIANSELTDMQDRKEWICKQEGILPEETDFEH